MSTTNLLPQSEAVFLEAGIGTWRWDASSGEFQLSDDGIAMLQVRADELPLGVDTIIGQILDEDVAGFQSAMAELITAPGLIEVDFRALLDDGDIRWYRAIGRSYASPDASVTHAAGVLLDVTTQRSAEQYYDAFFQQPNGMHLVASIDGEIRLTNSAWQLVLGHGDAELQGQNLLDLVHPEDREATLAEMGKLSQGMYTLYFENRYRHRDGSYRVIAWSAATAERESVICAVGRDISQEHAARRGLFQAAAVFKNSGEGILISDKDGRIRDVNAAFSRITGYSREDAIGQPTSLLRSGRHDGDFYADMWQTLQRDGVWRGEIWNRRKSGTVFPELLTISKIDGPDGGFMAIFTDISQLKETEEQLQKLAHYDPLTNLPNRFLVNECLEHSIRRAQRRSDHLAVFFLDIDSFKNINDSLGHFAGDKLLKTTANRLKALLRDDDSVGRIGGDEFLMVLDDISTPDDATHIAEKIIGALRKPMILEGRSISVSASIGISIYPEDGQTAETLMSNADAAMYNAKDQGRDTFRFYSEHLTRQAFQNVLIDSALREAVSRQEFRLAFQPQVNTDNGSLLGLEVLLRWHHLTLGTVSPSQFIPQAERTGLIRDIGHWVLEQSCLQGSRWIAEGLQFGHLAVNVSAPQFRAEDFVAQVRKVLADTEFPPEKLELELTESVLVHDTEKLIENMHELRALGVMFAIDDFGTGYSSLSYLKRMPIDRLKLDKSFVDHIVSDDSDRIIAGAVLALGKAMGLPVIAEGIEQEAQARVLQSLGCKHFQGYLYGRPMYGPRIEVVLRAHLEKKT
ncbi:bifunctional diguanylate cyclase/phosphodiesterase [Congregibacter litoralis]|uniref:Diguanylate cyclase/phosphodiesterase with PAS/PAC sensor(S) n=1 Tax=Congregibacter litoralis KT71 TaxID=314285 RepID=A4ACX6_9GAMM|nr:EAL domain-containing protein [Congregibacter litoralis]EAQ96167.2 diguanylate cyclase/phosphodiesterase with PAS/PAC sensor(s) [Congregibacter litoralis KT71]